MSTSIKRRYGFLYRKYTLSLNNTTRLHIHSLDPHKHTNACTDKTGLNQFFIITLSAAVVPQMPFIMQILNGICLIYQAWCKKAHSAGSIINNTLSETFQLQMRKELRRNDSVC